MTLTDQPFSGEPVSMVYAYQEEFGAIESGSTQTRQQGRAEQLWHAMKSQDNPFTQFMGAYSSSLAKDVAALQAADLFAYELTKEFENRVSRPNDSMRWALRQLLSKVDPDALLHFYSFDTLLVDLMDTGQLQDDVNTRITSTMLQLGIKMDMQDRAKP